MTYTKLINNSVIFSIDNAWNVHILAKFMRFIDTKRVMGEMQKEMLVCSGMWNGQQELSFYMDYNDFFTHVANSGYVDEQECFMIVNPVKPNQPNRKQASLLYRCGNQELVGSFTGVSKEEAEANNSYTYFYKHDLYFIAGKE